MFHGILLYLKNIGVDPSTKVICCRFEPLFAHSLILEVCHFIMNQIAKAFITELHPTLDIHFVYWDAVNLIYQALNFCGYFL